MTDKVQFRGRHVLVGDARQGVSIENSSQSTVTLTLTHKQRSLAVTVISDHLRQLFKQWEGDDPIRPDRPTNPPGEAMCERFGCSQLLRHQSLILTKGWYAEIFDGSAKPASFCLGPYPRITDAEREGQLKINGLGYRFWMDTLHVK